MIRLQPRLIISGLHWYSDNFRNCSAQDFGSRRFQGQGASGPENAPFAVGRRLPKSPRQFRLNSYQLSFEE